MAMNGIDISDHQHGINLEAVPADFVIMKATQGNWYTSPDCCRQYEQAKKAGKLLGLYHYADGTGGYAAEAAYFVNSIRNWIGSAILVIDWESDQNRQWWNWDYLDRLTKEIIRLTGVRPILYGMQSQYAGMKRIADANNCGLWIAQYANMTTTGYQSTPWNEGAYACAIRQYASTGRLSGWCGNLDLNKAYMDKNAWLAYANPKGAKPQPAPAPAKKSNDTIAAEVIAGKWGNGNDRVNRLKNAGYDPNIIQDIVNKKVGTPSVNLEDLATRTIRGEFGNGAARRQALGANYDAVMAIVNKRLGC